MSPMKTTPYSKKIVKLARKNGSTAETVKGAARFILAKGGDANKLWEHRRDRPSQIMHVQHKRIDVAKPGDRLTLNKYVNYGYKICRGPIDRDLESKSKDSAYKNNPRKKNWSSPETRIFLESDISVGYEPIYYKGRFKGYTGSYLFPTYQSSVAISPSGKSAVVITGNIMRKRVKAPAGTRFGKDELGLRVVRKTDKLDYHFAPEDLMRKGGFASFIRRKLAEKYIASLQSKKAEKAKKENDARFLRQIKNTYVSLEDSRRAGNCIEGSLAFAERKLGLDRKSILEGRWLFTVPAMKLMKTGDKRAEKSVVAAWQRETTVCI